MSSLWEVFLSLYFVRLFIVFAEFFGYTVTNVVYYGKDNVTYVPFCRLEMDPFLIILQKRKNYECAPRA